MAVQPAGQAELEKRKLNKKTNSLQTKIYRLLVEKEVTVQVSTTETRIIINSVTQQLSN
jgi:hypothetical protein